MYLAPQNIPRAISVLTLGNTVVLYCILATNLGGDCSYDPSNCKLGTVCDATFKCSEYKSSSQCVLGGARA